MLNIINLLDIVISPRDRLLYRIDQLLPFIIGFIILVIVIITIIVINKKNKKKW